MCQIGKVISKHTKRNFIGYKNFYFFNPDGVLSSLFHSYYYKHIKSQVRATPDKVFKHSEYGFWAFSKLDYAKNYYGSLTLKVRLYGHVVKHQKGFRASNIEFLGVLEDESWIQSICTISEAYKIPIIKK